MESNTMKTETGKDEISTTGNLNMETHSQAKGNTMDNNRTNGTMAESSRSLRSSPTSMANDTPRLATPHNYTQHTPVKQSYSESFSPHSTVNGQSSPPALTSPFQQESGVPGASIQVTVPGTGSVPRDTQRQINKVRRFLTTLQQFAADISSEAGDRVRGLVLSLLSTSISVEDFHAALQEVTHFPLRPFVLPFLRSHLPLLTRELHSLARRSAMTVNQYISSQESHILESSAGEPTDFFSSEVTHSKRKYDHSAQENGEVSSCNSGISMSHVAGNGTSGINSVSPPPAKRACLISPPYPPMGISPESFTSPRAQDDEWKNINVMLTCIMSMVEKTKRALSILQHREDKDNGRVTTEIRPRSDYETEVKRYATDLVAHAIRATEDRVAEVKRKAEEAVNEVRRAAVMEVQRAVSSAESRAQELVAAERGRIETMLREVARREISGEQKIEAHQACWNCGRKAQDTCSGCNVAKYCGAFCQHKDWEQHHKVCNTTLSSSSTFTTALTSKTAKKTVEISKNDI